MFASRPYLPRAAGHVALFYYAAGVVLLWIARGPEPLAGWWVGGTFGLGQMLAALVLVLEPGAAGTRFRRSSMGTTKKKSANASNPDGSRTRASSACCTRRRASGIMTSLVTRPEGLLFGDLKRLCALTDGNLSRHLEVLREAGLVEVWKGFENRRPQTLCRLSPEGRERFVAYLEQLEQVIRDAMPKAARRAERLPELPPGFQPA